MPDPSPETDLPAGDFAPWLHAMEGALAGEHGADVPCGTCTACCTSSQFVHIGPDEADTLAHVPRALRFPAPGLPPGHVLLGYDERGHCPMLVDGACSIYAHRPRACRTYDCRVFPAAGVEPEADKVLIAARAQRWRFGHPTDGDRRAHAAVRAAATYLDVRAAELPDDAAPRTATQRAVMAVEAHRAFLDGRQPEPEAVLVEVRRSRPRRPPERSPTPARPRRSPTPRR
jgi:Fe-S-cluster containining protein